LVECKVNRGSGEGGGSWVLSEERGNLCWQSITMYLCVMLLTGINLTGKKMRCYNYEVANDYRKLSWLENYRFCIFFRVILNGAPGHLLSMPKKKIKDEFKGDKITFCIFMALNAHISK
jgi:hypothetical protein